MATRAAPAGCAGGPARSTTAPAGPEGDVALLDGSVAHLRPIRPEDRDALDAFHERLSDVSVYRRYLGPHRHLRPGELDRLTRVDGDERVALVATLGAELVAVARYDRIPGTAEAEVAFVVADAVQRRGLGTLLLEHLALAARQRGIGSFQALTLGSNHLMQDVFGRSGFALERHAGFGTVDVRFPLALTGAYLDRVTERAVTATGAWLARRLGPQPPSPIGVVSAPGGRRSLVAAFPRLGAPEPIVVELEPDVDLPAALAYLAGPAGVEVVAVTAACFEPPYRRLAALGRWVSRRTPVLAALPSPGLASLWAQAGLEPAGGGAELARQTLRRLEARRRAPGLPAAPTALSDVPGCDPAAARAAIEAARLRAGAPVLLEPDRSRLILEAYGLQLCDQPWAGAPAGVTLAVGEQPGLGVVAQVLPPADRARPSFRLLPLTDPDVDALLRPFRLAGEAAARAGDLVRRMARLVDDQAELRSVRVSPGSSPAWSLWAEPRRGVDDEPAVRLLPVRRARRGG